MSGWIKTYRKMLAWEWFTDSNVVHVFLYLLLQANREAGKWKGIDVRCGQLITSANKIACDTGLTRQKVRTAISKLKTTNEITIKSTNKYLLVTVENWGLYQDGNNDINQQNNHQITNNQPTNNHQITNNQPTNNHQITTNKNIRNKEIIKPLSSELAGGELDGERDLEKALKSNEIGDGGNMRQEVLEGQTGVKAKSRKKRIYSHDDPYYKSAKWLAAYIETRIPEYKTHTEAQIQMWADSVRLMFEIDKRDRKTANALLIFSQNDSFWAENILSMPKFREQYDKLLAKYKKVNTQPVNSNCADSWAGIPTIEEVLANDA